MALTKRAVITGLDVGQNQAMLSEALFAEVLHNRHGRSEEGMARMRRRFSTRPVGGDTP